MPPVSVLKGKKSVCVIFFPLFSRIVIYGCYRIYVLLRKTVMLVDWVRCMRVSICECWLGEAFPCYKWMVNKKKKKI